MRHTRVASLSVWIIGILIFAHVPVLNAIAQDMTPSSESKIRTRLTDDAKKRVMLRHGILWIWYSSASPEEQLKLINALLEEVQELAQLRHLTHIKL
jgi:hypothetical protein